MFSLSPLKLSSSPSESCDNGFSHSFSLPGFDFDLVVRIEKSDDLVLTALARMLSYHFFKISFFSKKSFGFRTDRREFYGQLVGGGRVRKLYRFNLINSMNTISRLPLFLTLISRIH